MKQRSVPKSATSVPSVGTPVGVRDLRDHLSAYLERVKAGEIITVTEHGRPIARLVPDEPRSTRLMELAAQGRVTLATKPFPRWEDIPHVKYDGSIQDLMDEIRGR
jgi:prevent-host-death family protein